MTDPARPGLSPVLERFAESGTLVRRLALQNEDFRGMCEDYGLAQASLARFEALPDAPRRPEVAEYRTLIAELEAEISRFLQDAAEGVGLGRHAGEKA